jgi:glycosyltransferase involved in cell wall biosynthesis
MSAGVRPEVTFVIPVFDEPDNIEATLRSLGRDVKATHDILVVYDFEEDATVPVVRRLQPHMPEVQLLCNDLGSGVLNAMKSGIAAASAPFVIVSMADGSDDYRDVDDMVALARDGADLVAGSRYMKGGARRGRPGLKSLMSRAAGLSLHWFGGVATHDATNNFKLYRRDFLDSVTIESEGGFELALELTVKATLDGRAVAEVPTTWHDRAAGESNFRMWAWLSRYLRWYVALFAGRLRRLADRS